VFIGVGASTCMIVCVCIVFLKKRRSPGVYLWLEFDAVCYHHWALSSPNSQPIPHGPQEVESLAVQLEISIEKTT
jgi:hypothetical protein